MQERFKLDWIVFEMMGGRPYRLRQSGGPTDEGLLDGRRSMTAASKRSAGTHMYRFMYMCFPSDVLERAVIEH